MSLPERADPVAPAIAAQRASAPGRGWALIGGGLFAAFGWVAIGQRLGGNLAVGGPALTMAAYYALLFVPLIALAFGLGRVMAQPVWRAGAAPGRWLALGGALGLAGLLATVGFAWLNGEIAHGAGARIGGAMLIAGIGLTALQVGAEELLFRGWLQPALIGRIGAAGGIALGAVLFAALHLLAGARAPLSLVNLALGGLWFGLLAWRSGGIVAPFAAHLAWNALEDLGLGLTPNPGNGVLGSLTDLDLLGAPLWGGQEEGLNASIGATLVLIALMLPLLDALRPARPPVASGAAGR